MRAHPQYRGDSVVSQEINYDLMVAVDEMCVVAAVRCHCWRAADRGPRFDRERGLRKVPDFLPECYPRA